MGKSLNMLYLIKKYADETSFFMKDNYFTIRLYRNCDDIKINEMFNEVFRRTRDIILFGPSDLAPYYNR